MIATNLTSFWLYLLGLSDQTPHSSLQFVKQRQFSSSQWHWWRIRRAKWSRTIPNTVHRRSRSSCSGRRDLKYVNLSWNQYEKFALHNFHFLFCRTFKLVIAKAANSRWWICRHISNPLVQRSKIKRFSSLSRRPFTHHCIRWQDRRRRKARSVVSLVYSLIPTSHSFSHARSPRTILRSKKIEFCWRGRSCKKL